MSNRTWHYFWTTTIAVAVWSVAAVTAASEHSGRVTFNGVAVPGASVVATQGDRNQQTVSDADGSYTFSDLSDGIWTVRVEMLGFAAVSEEITVAAGAAPRDWSLALRSFAELKAAIPDRAPPVASTPASTPSSIAPLETGQRAVPQTSGASGRNPQNPAQQARAEPGAGDPGLAAADGFLINGSVNNGAVSPFAQLAAFGNNRRGRRSQYNGGLGVVFGNSAWDARPFSFSNDRAARPSYNDLQVLSTFGGPLTLPRVSRFRPIVFVGYQRVVTHNAIAQSGLMPTEAERRGDFSGRANAAGAQSVIIDPLTGQPFPGNRIPGDRISPQAAALLQYYPQPNTAASNFNYQVPVVESSEQDSVQFRATQNLGNRDSLFGNVNYQRNRAEGANLFGFVDSSRRSATEVSLNWSHRFSQFMTLRLRFQSTGQGTDATPYFANRVNVSGDAGIPGNSQAPEDWGPPSLLFSSGISTLATAQFASNRNRTDTWSAETARTIGRHSLTVGGAWGRSQWDLRGQQDARGGFSFTGAATGSDVADFLLGLPATTSIAFGNPDKALRGYLWNLFLNDDWRASPSLTVNVGVRWEFESPLREEQGRLANLDLLPGFSSATVVTPGVSSERYPATLVNPDYAGVQPRVGLAWRPIAGSSLVVRGGYGIYRNTNVYQTLATLLAQQPPFSNTFSRATNAADPLTLVRGFKVAAPATSNTFAIDPELRIGSAHTWQASAQRDLPASLTIIATYLGTKGTNLMQEFLPNTYPAGAFNPCPLCPSGFVYLTSGGRSLRNAGQVELRRRLRNGITATAQYTLAKAADNASAFVPAGVAGTNSGIGGAVIAQDWLDLDAEYGRSSFDQRHLLTAQVEYTSGMGVTGGTLLEGLKGRLLKGWTMTGQLTFGSGLPLTPVYLVPTLGTGVTGTIRGRLTGAPTEGPEGYFANPGAYAAPAAGQWGDAERNSITGPRQFALNAGIGRSLLWGERMNFDWRLEATNVLNQVTYTGVNTIVGSPQFGLPNRASAMRKVQANARLRF